MSADTVHIAFLGLRVTTEEKSLRKGGWANKSKSELILTSDDELVCGFISDNGRDEAVINREGAIELRNRLTEWIERNS